MVNIVSKMSKHSHTLIIVLVTIIVLGSLYMLVSMRNSNDKEGFVSYHEGPVNWNKDKDVLIVFCKMEGCGHCVAFTPAWEAVEKKLNGKKLNNGKACRMVVVDPSHELSEGVAGFPTIKRYESGNVTEFEDQRTEDNLVAFINGN